MEPFVGRVDPARTAPLRQALLRPHETLERVASVGRDDESLRAFGAYLSEDGPLVSCAIVLREEPPQATIEIRSPDEHSWRLRGMATSPTWRNCGVGRRVLDAVVAHVASFGPGVLWCNARERAIPFYERAGFSCVGERFDEPAIGRHVRMWLPLHRS